jgi:Fe-S-cluster containining protein
LFPELYLTIDGQYFLEVHGLWGVTLEELRRMSTVLSNGQVKIRRRCNQLTEEGLCGIYERRPQLCREYRCESRAIMVFSDRCDSSRKYIPLQVVNG